MLGNSAMQADARGATRARIFLPHNTHEKGHRPWIYLPSRRILRTASKRSQRAPKCRLPFVSSDIHGNVILKHRMSGAPAFSIELSERKAYTSALVGLRTAELSPLVQPGQELFPLMGLSGGRFCSMGGGAPLTSEGQLVAGVGVSGGSVEQDVSILEIGTPRSRLSLPSPQNRMAAHYDFTAHAQPRTGIR